MSTYVSGTFFNDSLASDAIDDLIDLGYPRQDIDVIMSPHTRGRFAKGNAPGESQGTKVATGAASGGVIGGALGAIVAGLTATGAITATVATGGVAAPLVAGPLAAVLAGGGAGAALGGIVGALAGAGMPESGASKVAHDIEAGGIVIGVRARDEDVADVRSILADVEELDSSGELVNPAPFENP